MKFYQIISLLFLSATALNAQGFDWQYSARLPFETPRFYWGFNTQFGLQSSNGRILFSENTIQCQNFEDAAGNNYSLGIQCEYWERQNRYTFRAALQYGFNTISSKSTDFIPYSSTLTAEFENQLNISFSQINLKAGGKYRIAQTHLNIGANLALAFIVLNDFNITERIVGPPEIPPFAGTSNPYEREILNGQISSFVPLRFYPEINIGYDIELGLGTYLEPTLTLAFPLTSMFSGAKVSNYSTSFGLKFYRKF